MNGRSPRGAGSDGDFRAALVVLGVLSILFAFPAQAAAPVQTDPAIEIRVDRLIRRSVEFIYEGQLDSAQAAVEAAAAIAPDDPRVGLFRFRMLRENYPDDLNEEERALRLAPLLLAPLDQTIAQCDSILELRQNDSAATLYRGWAHMMKAQTHAIAGQVWAAGSESRRGKNDLDRYLSNQPGDPDAGVIVGGYLYFADILPGIVKFIKFFARVPGGNKDRGLELLATGARTQGTYTTTDAQIVLAVIYYLFEGRIEDAREAFSDLILRYPYNPRVVELYGSTALVFPELSMEAIAAQNRLLAVWGTRVRGWEEMYYYRLLWLRARLWNQVGEHEAARQDLERIVDASLVDPFWLTPRALIGLASLAANRGEPDLARSYAARVLSQSGWSRYHEQARRYEKAPVSRRQRELFADQAEIRQAIYGKEEDPAATRRMIADARERYGADPRLSFLEAELDHEVGAIEAARSGYESIVATDMESAFESMRLMSYMRLGEIALAAGRYAEATRNYEQARKIESGYTLLGNVIRGRLIFISEAKKGR